MTAFAPVARFAPAAGAALFLAALAAPLLDPGRVLAARDVPQLHLPLRATFARLAVAGLPEWNHWIGGGQPLLSDPSYAAFYPTTWLALVVSPGWSLSLTVVLHLAFAQVGAWLLARRLGARPSVAALAAIGWAGSGALLSLVHALNELPGAAWLPWVLLATDATLAAPNARSALRPVCALAAALAMTLLAGDPVMALVCALGAACFALTRRGPEVRSFPRSLARVAVAGALALAFAAVQLVPAVARLAGTERGGGLDWQRAVEWSLPPARALEVVLPKAFGDPLRLGEGLHFGWGIHDRAFPFVVSIYPALAILVLGVAALARRGIERRASWTAMALAGVVLALGRHTPIYRWLYDFLPPFSAVRYPEKFVVLPAAALVFAAALGLERLLAEREAGRRDATNLPLALAGAVTLVAGVSLALALWAPGRIESFVSTHYGIPAGVDVLESALRFYRRQSGIAFGFASATLAGIALVRSRRPRADSTALALGALVAISLFQAHHALLGTLPAAAYEPPPLARALIGTGARIWSTADLEAGADLLVRGPGAHARDLSTRIARLDSWVGATWGISYPLATDFALLFTPPQKQAIETARRLWSLSDREPFYRLLGAWGITRTVVHRSAAEVAAELRAGHRDPTTARLQPNAFALPVERFVTQAMAFPDGDAARAAWLSAGTRVDEREFLIDPPWQGERLFDGAARVVESTATGDRMTLRVEVAGPALLVVATTFDRHWRARADGAEVPVVEAALGYFAVPLPAGTRQVELVYRDPWLRIGFGVTLVALAATALVLRRRPRRAA